MEAQLKFAYEKQSAAITTEYGAQAKYNKRGFCPQHPGLCPAVKLAVRRGSRARGRRLGATPPRSGPRGATGAPWSRSGRNQCSGAAVNI